MRQTRGNVHKVYEDEDTGDRFIVIRCTHKLPLDKWKPDDYVSVVG